mmetsp:Transcript_3614/g.7835  ORF Transcript_3614/g.7835 Transcript_3614/m.7835 type:complete len:144 (-) Transcript_3614:6-437(-)
MWSNNTPLATRTCDARSVVRLRVQRHKGSLSDQLVVRTVGIGTGIGLGGTGETATEVIGAIVETGATGGIATVTEATEAIATTIEDDRPSNEYLNLHLLCAQYNHLATLVVGDAACPRATASSLLGYVIHVFAGCMWEVRQFR